ncbi:MAG: WD40 repeat domain-containing protein [Fimbriimonadaceae bacterium]
MMRKILTPTLAAAFLAAVGTAIAQPTVAWTSDTTLGGESRSTAWSPDGTQVVVGTAFFQGTVRAYNASTGLQTWSYMFPFANDRIKDFQYSPDGTILYIYLRAQGANPGGVNNRVARLNPTNGTPIGTDWVPNPSLTSAFTNLGGISLNGDGTRLAFSQVGNRVLTIFDTSDGSVVAETANLPGTGTAALSWDPTGPRIAVLTQGSAPDRGVHIYTLSGSALTLTGSSPDFGANPTWVRWAPNGSFIAVRGSNNISIVDPNNITGPITTLVSGITFTFNAMIAVSNDSSKIATAFGASGMGVYDASDGSVIGTITGLGGLRPVAFNPAGDSVVTANSSGTTYRIDGFGPPAPEVGGTIFWEGPNSGPLPRLMVAWRTNEGSVVVPTVVIDVAPVNWQVRTVGPLVDGDTDSLVWQNTDLGFSIPGLIAYWNLDTDGTPTPGGTGGAPPSIDWEIRAFRDLSDNGISDVLWVNTANDLVAIWYRDEDGNVAGTATVGTVPTGWSLVTAGTENRIFFQNDSTSLVAYWSLDAAGVVTGTTTVGVPGPDWILEGFGQFDASSALLFRNTSSNLLAYWDIDSAGVVTGTGTLGEAPAGWFILGVGRL